MHISLKITYGIGALVLAILVGCLLCAKTNILVEIDHFPKNDKEQMYKAYVDIEPYKDLFFIVENIPGFRLLAYKRTGEFRMAMGKSGYKPEEFSSPMEMSIWGNEVFVKDNGGLSIYGVDGRFSRRVRPFIHIVSFVVVKDQIFILCGTPGQKKLIHVFSLTGKFLSGFGDEFATLDYSLYKSMSPIHAKGSVYHGKLLSDGKYIYYLNSSFGRALAFTLEGRKIADKNIVGVFGEYGRTVAEANTTLWLKEGIDLKKTGGRIPERELFRDAYLCGGRIYILSKYWTPGDRSYKDKIFILDKYSFALLEEDLIQKAKDDSVMSLCVEEVQGNPVFYFTKARSEANTVIAVYGREN